MSPEEQALEEQVLDEQEAAELEEDKKALEASEGELNELIRVKAIEAVDRHLAHPDDIRAKGWSVAAHNDYRFDGSAWTFWLFTKAGICVKGEGRTDASALMQVRRQIRMHEEGITEEDLAEPDGQDDRLGDRGLRPGAGGYRHGCIGPLETHPQLETLMSAERDYPDIEIKDALQSFGSWLTWIGNGKGTIAALRWKAAQGDDLPEELEELRDAIASFGAPPIDEVIERVLGLEKAFRDVGELALTAEGPDDMQANMQDIYAIAETVARFEMDPEPVKEPTVEPYEQEAREIQLETAFREVTQIVTRMALSDEERIERVFDLCVRVSPPEKPTEEIS